MADRVECIEEVCESAKSLRERIIEYNNKIAQLLNDLAYFLQHIRCVITGPAGKICATKGIDAAHPTLNEMLGRLNACSLDDIEPETFTASAGQDTITLATSIANANLIEVVLNGSIQNEGLDYSLAGGQVVFKYPLLAGDQVDTRVFTV